MPPKVLKRKTGVYGLSSGSRGSPQLSQMVKKPAANQEQKIGAHTTADLESKNTTASPKQQMKDDSKDRDYDSDGAGEAEMEYDLENDEDINPFNPDLNSDYLAIDKQKAAYEDADTNSEATNEDEKRIDKGRPDMQDDEEECGSEVEEELEADDFSRRPVGKAGGIEESEARIEARFEYLKKHSTRTEAFRRHEERLIRRFVDRTPLREGEEPPAHTLIKPDHRGFYAMIPDDNGDVEYKGGGMYVDIRNKAVYRSYNRPAIFDQDPKGRKREEKPVQWMSERAARRKLHANREKIRAREAKNEGEQGKGEEVILEEGEPEEVEDDAKDDADEE